MSRVVRTPLPEQSRVLHDERAAGSEIRCEPAPPGSTPAPLPAGDFAAWGASFEAALQGSSGSNVPCHQCTACCTSSQFIHVEPDETDTLAHIPQALLFAAPGLPRGHRLLGYDEQGHCPMFVGGECSIYEHRPRTCRTYDCRVFSAAALIPNIDRPAIAQQAQRWHFTYSSENDQTAAAAVRKAALYLDEHAGMLPDGLVPASVARRAVLAFQLHELFLTRSLHDDSVTLITPPLETVRVELERRRSAERQRQTGR